jgi:hypothetical protein
MAKLKELKAEQINELEARRIQAMNEAKAMESGRTISDMDRQIMMYGGEMKRYANGGEIEAMLAVWILANKKQWAS